jgi:hypothetical protein
MPGVVLADPVLGQWSQDLEFEFSRSYTARPRLKNKQTNKQGQGSGEIAQLLRAPAVLAEDPAWVPSTHFKELTTICNSSSRRFDALLWLSCGLQT